MDLIESNTHSFIIRVWIEEVEEATGRARWRGHITHVPGGERRYIENLDSITGFIARYLEDMGASPGPGRRAPQWLYRLAQYFSRKG